MDIDYDIDLFKYNTMRTHSIASVMYTPNDVKELKDIIETCKKKCFFLGGGSNIVFASQVKTPIVNLMKLNETIVLNSNNSITAGCSTRIQKLINFGKNNAMGGFEYLYSLPASVGGIVYMNAGRGRKYHQQISDWLIQVEYLDLEDMLIKTMKINKKLWKYRQSPFHEMNAVILTATFKMEKSSIQEVATRIQERKDTVKRNQEANKPSCGSIFNKENKLLMRIIRGKRIGGAYYSRKTNNWICNDKSGTGDDVIALIEYAQKWHKMFGLECVPEVRIIK